MSSNFPVVFNKKVQDCFSTHWNSNFAPKKVSITGKRNLPLLYVQKLERLSRIHRQDEKGILEIPGFRASAAKGDNKVNS